MLESDEAAFIAEGREWLSHPNREPNGAIAAQKVLAAPQTGAGRHRADLKVGPGPAGTRTSFQSELSNDGLKGRSSGLNTYGRKPLVPALATSAAAIVASLLLLLPSLTSRERSVAEVSSQTQGGQQATQTSGQSTTTSRSVQSTPVPIGASRAVAGKQVTNGSSAPILSGAGTRPPAEANSSIIASTKRLRRAGNEHAYLAGISSRLCQLFWSKEPSKAGSPGTIERARSVGERLVWSGKPSDPHHLRYAQARIRWEGKQRCLAR